MNPCPKLWGFYFTLIFVFIYSLESKVAFYGIHIGNGMTNTNLFFGNVFCKNPFQAKRWPPIVGRKDKKNHHSKMVHSRKFPLQKEPAAFAIIKWSHILNLVTF